jgi:hypothetical protein
MRRFKSKYLYLQRNQHPQPRNHPRRRPINSRLNTRKLLNILISLSSRNRGNEGLPKGLRKVLLTLPRRYVLSTFQVVRTDEDRLDSQIFLLAKLYRTTTATPPPSPATSTLKMKSRPNLRVQVKDEVNPNNSIFKIAMKRWRKLLSIHLLLKLKLGNRLHPNRKYRLRRDRG